MSEWQDIKTAPRDGTEFMAWILNGEKQGFWEPRARFEPVDGGFEMWGRVDYDQEGWELVYMWLTPTHWMPQPSAPTPTSKEE
jgi:hypothetical protein